MKKGCSKIRYARIFGTSSPAVWRKRGSPSKKRKKGD